MCNWKNKDSATEIDEKMAFQSPMHGDMLLSAYEIRRAMGSELLDYLKKHDAARYEHARTKTLRAQCDLR